MSTYILLDRDGVINRRIVNGYVTSWEQFEFLPRALDALRLLSEHDFKIIVVSNQAGVSKGLMSSDVLNELTRLFLKEVANNGGCIQGVYYCPHQEQDGCNCRKPKPGLLKAAQRDHHFVFTDTFLIGDSQRDLMAALQVGCPAILIEPAGTNLDAQESPSSSDARFPDLYAAAQFILSLRDRKQRSAREETPSVASGAPARSSF